VCVLREDVSWVSVLLELETVNCQLCDPVNCSVYVY